MGLEAITATGRRKTAIAKIFVSKGNGKITINERDYKKYFSTTDLQEKVNRPFEITDTKGKFNINAKIKGGGIKGQAEALRLAISRALSKYDVELRKSLKDEGFLTRDPRMVERKKYGRKKARKRFQFTKR